MTDTENQFPWQEINWSGSISELVQIGRRVGKRRFVLRSGVMINCLQGGFGSAVDRCQWRITAPMPDLVAQIAKQLVEELRSRGVQCRERVLSDGRICYVDEDDRNENSTQIQCQEFATACEDGNVPPTSQGAETRHGTIMGHIQGNQVTVLLDDGQHISACVSRRLIRSAFIVKPEDEVDVVLMPSPKMPKVVRLWRNGRRFE